MDRLWLMDATFAVECFLFLSGPTILFLLSITTAIKEAIGTQRLVLE